MWRAPGLRIARLEQDVPGAGDRVVFDEVADGLGALGAIVAEYHRAAMRVAETEDAAALERLGELQHQLEERDGWRLEQKVEMVLSRLSLPADRPMRELSGGWRRRALLGKALVSDPDLLLLDEPTNHLDIDAIQWLEDHLREFCRRAAVRDARPHVPLDAGHADRRARSRTADVMAGQLPASTSRRRRRRSAPRPARSHRLDKKLEKEEAWLRQGVKARRTRNEGRVRDLMALRAQRAAWRAQSGMVRMAIDATDTSGKLVFEADRVSKALGGIPVVRDFSQRILRGDRIGLIGPERIGQDDAAAGCSWGRWSPTRGK